MEWVPRLMYEADHSKVRGWWITFTVSDDSMKRFYARMYQENGGVQEPYYKRINSAMAIGVKWWRERVRQKTGKTPKFWLVTELGADKGRIHLHGFVWNDDKSIFDLWDYGWNKVKPIQRSKIKYATKYVFKTQEKHKEYVPKIFCSNGIGSGYETSYNATNNKYVGEDTDEGYRTSNGYKIALPKYYRNKIYSEEERELLWIHKLDRQERYVLGKRIDISKGFSEYYARLQYAREINRQQGFLAEEDWTRTIYQRTLDLIGRGAH